MVTEEAASLEHVTTQQGWWATEDEADLIRAARGDLTAWNRCRERIDDMGGLASRLGPEVFRHVLRDDPHRGLLKGTYRRAFYSRQLLFKATADALDVLTADGIETMLLKGVALSELTSRTVNTADVLVRPSQLEAAITALDEAAVRSANGLDLALHAYAFDQFADDEDLWVAAEPTTLLGRSTLAPCSTDHLMIICAHGLRSSHEGPSWMADALALIEAEPPDWGRLVASASRRRLTVALAAALAHLAARYHARVPPRALDELRATSGRSRSTSSRAGRPSNMGGTSGR